MKLLSTIIATTLLSLAAHLSPGAQARVYKHYEVQPLYIYRGGPVPKNLKFSIMERGEREVGRDSTCPSSDEEHSWSAAAHESVARCRKRCPVGWTQTRLFCVRDIKSGYPKEARSMVGPSNDCYKEDESRSVDGIFVQCQEICQSDLESTGDGRFVPSYCLAPQDNRDLIQVEIRTRNVGTLEWIGDPGNPSYFARICPDSHEYVSARNKFYQFCLRPAGKQ